MKRKIKFLVLGAGGMAGSTISRYLTERKHDVTGFDMFELFHCKSIIGDAHNTKLLEKIILDNKYDAVINCIGILNEFADQNKPQAVYLNSYLPHFLTYITQNLTTQIIHMSTDCVFSGKKGGYTENDKPDGDSFYDRSKALGEINDDKNITFRNSIIGPDLNEKGIGLLNWFMKQDGTINGYSEVLWTGLTTLQLAKVMEKAAEVKATGLYNMVNNGFISKYELLLLFNKYLRNNSINIIPNDEIVVNKTLIRTNYNFDFDIPNYETMIYEMACWIRTHPFYSHYKM